MGRAKTNKTSGTDVPKAADKPKRSRKQTASGADGAKVPKATTTRKSSRKGADKAEDAKKKAETFWTSDLTGKLYTAIIENETIKRGLFPPPGSNASTKDGGGKAKTEFHAMLARDVFGGENCEHKVAFEAARTKSEKEAWVTKVKNKIAYMTKATRKHCTSLGQTGAGIQSADEIDRTQKNDFVNKFEEILDEFPLFFEWRELIGERPNVNPVGVGNMDSELDLAVLGDEDGGTSVAEDDDDNEDEEDGDENVDELDPSDGAEMSSDNEAAPASVQADADKPPQDVANISSDEEEAFPCTMSGVIQAKMTARKAGKADKANSKDGVEKAVEKDGAVEKGKKRKANESEGGAKPSVDDAATTKKVDTRPAKKSKPIDAVMEVAVEEEKTKQMQLAFAKSQSELNIEKVKADSAVKTQMIKAKAIESKNKSEEKRLKLQIKMKELELREREMMMSRGDGNGNGNNFGTFRSPSLTHQASQSPFESRSTSPFPRNAGGISGPLEEQLMPQHTTGLAEGPAGVQGGGSSSFAGQMGYGPGFGDGLGGHDGLF